VRIEVSVDRTSYRPGEEVRGQVAILEGGPARRLLVRLRLDEVTPNVRVAAVTVDGGELARGDLRAGEGYAFRIPLPDDALPSCAGTRSALEWAAEAQVDRRGSDPVDRAVFTVPAPERP
jgi:hypothetical protein